ncbi:MAG: hypothetical protein ABIT58_03930 [Ferruginibacter sp.]
MKKIFFILFVCCLFTKAKADTKIYLKLPVVPDTLSYPLSQLSAINTSSYIGRPINEFLADLDNLAPGYVLSNVYGLDGRRLATRLDVYYLNGFAFTIVVQKTQFTPQFNQDLQWDINLFRQESITRIEFYRNDSCLSGCPN